MALPMPDIGEPSKLTDDPPGAPRGALISYRLTDGETRAALQLARQCADTYGSLESPAFLADVGAVAGDLPPAVRQAVQAGRLDEAKHAMVLTGAELDEADLPATPQHWREANNEATTVHAFLLMLYAALLGDAIGWATQQDGRLVTDVLPIAGYETTLVSASSKRELGWHTEDAFSPCRADHVGLYCLRNPQAIPTTVSYVDPAAIPGDVATVLREPRFHTLPDTSHEPVADPGSTGPEPPASALTSLRENPPSVAVLRGPEQAPVLCVDSDFTVPARGDAKAASALLWLTDHLNQNLYDVALRPGDTIFLDNRNVVHGRRAFQPSYDGRDRWLKRANIVTDLRRVRPGLGSAGSRVIG